MCLVVIMTALESLFCRKSRTGSSSYRPSCSRAIVARHSAELKACPAFEEPMHFRLLFPCAYLINGCLFHSGNFPGMLVTLSLYCQIRPTYRLHQGSSFELNSVLLSMILQKYNHEKGAAYAALELLLPEQMDSCIVAMDSRGHSEAAHDTE